MAATQTIALLTLHPRKKATTTVLTAQIMDIYKTKTVTIVQIARLTGISRKIA
jgi:hypothetical protein